MTIEKIVVAAILALSCLLGCRAETSPQPAADESTRAGLEPPNCQKESESLVRAYDIALAAVSRACQTDADCRLVETSLPCVELCPIAVAKSAADGVYEIHSMYALQCSLCRAAFDCSVYPNDAACVGGTCVEVRRPDGG